MQLILVLGVYVMTAGAPAQAPTAAQPITITFVKSTVEDALSFLARAAGMTVEIDESVTVATRREPLTDDTLKLHGVTFEEALTLIVNRKGLAYSIEGKTMRVYRK
ncbi:MAG TPA: hypothetical protein VEC39_09965 [Vicinamibacterales bacterium]|nr:hypothetical protein [Vicinamibacterales bacterium]